MISRQMYIKQPQNLRIKIEPKIYGQSSFDMCAKEIPGLRGVGEGPIFSALGAGQPRTMKLNHLILYLNTNSKCHKDPDMGATIIPDRGAGIIQGVGQCFLFFSKRWQISREW